MCAIVSGNSGGDAFRCIDRNREGGFHAFVVAPGHLWKIEFFGTFGSDGRADQAATVDRHEVDHFPCAQRGRTNEIGFVFAIRIIRDDDDFSGGDFLNDFVDGVEVKSWHELGRVNSE